MAFPPDPSLFLHFKKGEKKTGPLRDLIDTKLFGIGKDSWLEATKWSGERGRVKGARIRYQHTAQHSLHPWWHEHPETHKRKRKEKKNYSCASCPHIVNSQQKGSLRTIKILREKGKKKREREKMQVYELVNLPLNQSDRNRWVIHHKHDLKKGPDRGKKRGERGEKGGIR